MSTGGCIYKGTFPNDKFYYGRSKRKLGGGGYDRSKWHFYDSAGKTSAILAECFSQSYKPEDIQWEMVFESDNFTEYELAQVEDIFISKHKGNPLCLNKLNATVPIEDRENKTAKEIKKELREREKLRHGEDAYKAKQKERNKRFLQKEREKLSQGVPGAFKCLDCDMYIKAVQGLNIHYRKNHPEVEVEYKGGERYTEILKRSKLEKEYGEKVGDEYVLRFDYNLQYVVCEKKQSNIDE